MHHVTTRRATPADLATVAALFDAYRQFYEQAPDLALASAFIRNRLVNNESVILVAEDAGHGIVGFCQIYPTFCSVEARPIYVLYDLFVAPPARRSGAGKCLLQAAESAARADGKVRMDLTTARSNTIAQSAYESLGWIRDEVFLSYSRRIQP